jgi:hypothetical protein
MFIESFRYLRFSPNRGDMYLFIVHDAPTGAWRIPVTTYKHIVPTALGGILHHLGVTRKT